jgi:hypothetical protein
MREAMAGAGHRERVEARTGSVRGYIEARH